MISVEEKIEGKNIPKHKLRRVSGELGSVNVVNKMVVVCT